MAHSMTSRSVDQARKTLTKTAEALGYLVTHLECESGSVIVTLFGLDPARPCVRLIEVVPEERAEVPSTLRERVVRAGVAIPDRITPAEVHRVLDLLAEIERTA